MDVETIKRNVRDAVSELTSFDELKYRNSYESDGELHIAVQTGTTVTESMIEADFHSSHFKPISTFEVIADPEDGTVTHIEEVERFK